MCSSSHCINRAGPPGNCGISSTDLTGMIGSFCMGAKVSFCRGGGGVVSISCPPTSSATSSPLGRSGIGGVVVVVISVWVVGALWVEAFRGRLPVATSMRRCPSRGLSFSKVFSVSNFWAASMRWSKIKPRVIKGVAKQKKMKKNTTDRARRYRFPAERRRA